ncbi:hypothetical protein EG327_009241 [Venturia inaequalis]|uniref:Uncharacterized protein n=1 Tax=Venturia inaequalis TaxID=5025 RepID=A0A8H3YTJ1_VENIN|nr:hypothetical protein EG327_009241 [Venturia inaequalis]
MAKRKQADIQPAETNSETSRTSATDTIFSDNESISQATNQTDIDSDSDLSTSSEEPSSESDDDSDSGNESETTGRASTQDSEDITNLRPGTKPNMKLGAMRGGLLQRLKTFIPELAAANQELDRERLDGTIERRNIERVDEGDGTFIELDLGLGVLEEKSGDITTIQHDSISDLKQHNDDDAASEQKHTDVISQLMGQAKKDGKAVQIQDLGE